MKPKDIVRFLISFFLIFMLFGSTANATTINLDYSFSLTTDGTNPYGLSAGDIVTVYTTLDDTEGYSDSGYTTHTFSDDPNFIGDTSDPSFAMSFDFGNTSFYQGDDDDWSYWPAVSISDADGSISVIDFLWTADDDSSMVSIGVENIGDPIILTASSMDGTWSITGTPVPEPTTFTLFGLGLFTLAGICRKRSLK